MAKVYTKKTSTFKSPVKILGLMLVSAGIISLVFFFFPIISWHVYFSKALATESYEVPLPKSMVINASSSSIQSLIKSGVSQFTTDFSDARNWYPTVDSSIKRAKIDKYTLSIPSIGLENAIVSTTSYDLKKHLVQYAGTAVPGDAGTAVIFGHSTLPQLFKNDDYSTIFANLHKIKSGDELLIKAKGGQFTYKVYAILITEPDNTDMFLQSFDNSYITLITCTPPGTLWKRLIVRARLQNI